MAENKNKTPPKSPKKKAGATMATKATEVPCTKKVASAQKAVLTKRTAMAKDIAVKWVKAKANPEFRFTVYISGGEFETKKFSNLIKGFRDGNINIRGVIQKKEIGISESFDSITFWSSELSCIKTLCDWFEEKGHDTTGIWW